MSEEPVLEINHSSCESDEMIIEERPLREIIKGYSVSFKSSPAKKDLTFDMSLEHSTPPLIDKVQQKSFSLSVVLNNDFAFPNTRRDNPFDKDLVLIGSSKRREIHKLSSPLSLRETYSNENNDSV